MSHREDTSFALQSLSVCAFVKTINAYSETHECTVSQYVSQVVYIYHLALHNQSSFKTEERAFFISVINQLDAQNLFYNKFISCLYMFRAPCAHRQAFKIVLYSLWYHHTYRWPSCAQIERGLVPTRPLSNCVQFWPPDDEHIVLETCIDMK